MSKFTESLKKRIQRPIESIDHDRPNPVESETVPAKDGKIPQTPEKPVNL